MKTLLIVQKYIQSKQNTQDFSHSTFLGLLSTTEIFEQGYENRRSFLSQNFKRILESDL